MRAMALTLLLLLAWAWMPAKAAAPVDQPLLLRDSGAAFDGWDAASVLFDDAGTLSVQQVLDRQNQFAHAGRLRANLGKRAGAAWLRIPVRVPVGDAGRWVLDIDYASLDRIDVHLVDSQRVEHHWLLGDHVDWADRPMPGRSHAALLALPPGETRVLLLRVQTTGSMVVPVMLYSQAEHLQVESGEQALQGLFVGAGLCLLLYSLSQWVGLRDAMFGWYALTLLGTTAFFAALSGIGPQYLWGGSQWLTRNGPPFFILLGVCGAFFFVLRALEVASFSPRTAVAVRICGYVAGITALLYLAGALSYQAAQTIGMALGPTPLILVLPTAFARLRAGDRAARYVLIGWGFYSAGVLVLVSLLRGWLPVGFWTLHTFQFTSLIEMSMWMVVLAERVQSVRREANRVQGEHRMMRALAHTDALTGLLNRRGLQESVTPMLQRCNGAQALAIYLLDLDGFKPINDSLGHEAGDELLVGVAQRLRSVVRSSDLVCRLGGDEFVLAVPDLPGDDEAAALGAKLLAAFEQPFMASGQLCRVGLTVGYALAPHDEATLADLLKRADAAMYVGKQAGRNCVRRGRGQAVLHGA